MEEPKIAKKDTLAREFRRVEITRAIKLKTDAEIASFSFGFDLGESSNLDSGSKQEGRRAVSTRMRAGGKTSGAINGGMVSAGATACQAEHALRSGW